MKILIGTKNQAKAREMKEILGEEFEIVSLADLPNAPDVEESGRTFEENAKLKAEAYHDFSGLPTIADDGGFEIDVLGGEPGVLSRRWPSIAEVVAGKPMREATDEELVEMTLEKLSGMPRDLRAAHLTTVVAFFDGTRMLTARESVDGFVTNKAAPIKEKGFPFRALFLLPQFGKLYQDLTTDEHKEVNHRRRAWLRLREMIKAPAAKSVDGATV